MDEWMNGWIDGRIDRSCKREAMKGEVCVWGGGGWGVISSQREQKNM